ncbi:unnamed protein product [Plutella xylostella]|uniref:(diamondback moth) hypothetical protein n=1 Tax=Plutella xylostella TaxID=51655 RepID=A0A8S4FMW7_PLUXY|nr:unnamed protein product [Plutella xylostella]
MNIVHKHRNEVIRQRTKVTDIAVKICKLKWQWAAANFRASKVAAWDEKKKMWSVVFDKMTFEAALTYDKNKDSINGFVELNEKKNEFADHALVFMLRGAVYKWHLPVTFYYCQGATSGMQLKSILKDVISAVVECGLKPIASVPAGYRGRKGRGKTVSEGEHVVWRESERARRERRSASRPRSLASVTCVVGAGRILLDAPENTIQR